MGLQFLCSCGSALRVADDAVGKVVKCPHCHAAIRVPNSQATSKPALAPVSPLPPPIVSQDDSRQRPKLVFQDLTFGRLLSGIGGSWLVLLIVSAFTRYFLFFGPLVTVSMGIVAFGLMRAKSAAILTGESSTWLGLMKVVAWDPNQGVLFLKDKKIGLVDSDSSDGGGVVILLPWLGEELAFRAPLEVRTTKFEDSNVLTREYVPLTIRGAIYWRLIDLEQFYLSVSRAIHEVDDRGNRGTARGYDHADALDQRSLRAGTPHQLQAGEEWLRLIAEEQTRAEVLQARTGLLVADKIVEGLPAEMQSLLATDSYQSAADGLGESIRRRLESTCIQYGIQVDRVTLQEIQLDERIRHKAISACMTAYDPLMAQRAATGKKMDLEADAYGAKKVLEGQAEVIGADAVAKREVLGSIHPFALGGRYAGLVEFLTHVFEEKDVAGQLPFPDIAGAKPPAAAPPPRKG